MIQRKQAILDKIKRIESKEKEIIYKSRKLINSPRTVDNMIYLNSLYDDYKSLKTKKEFCEYCLMFDYIESD